MGAPRETLLCILELDEDASEEAMVRAVFGVIAQRDTYRDRLTQTSVDLFRRLCASRERVRDLERQLAGQNTAAT